MEKAELRRSLLELRTLLDPAERQRLSALAQAALIGSEPFQAARTILLYDAFRGEVATEAIAAAAVAVGKDLVLPRVIKAPRGLVLHRYNGDPGTLAVGAYGIREPRADWPVVAPAAIDLVVVPGVGFDPAGNRLGYGGGYYDRLLPDLRAANPAVILVGLACRIQVVDRLPSDPHDVRMDALALENGFTWRRGNA